MSFEPWADFVESTMERVRALEDSPLAGPKPQAIEWAARASAVACAGTGAFLGLAGLGRFCMAFLFPVLC